MNYYLEEINKPIQDYFINKPGDILIASETKKKYYIIKSDRFDFVYISFLSFSSVGSMHYYCKVSYYPIYVSDKPKGKTIVGGYMGGLLVKDIIVIEITRKITKKDHREYPIRWYKEDIGLHTTAFYSVESIGKKLVPFIKEYFSDKKIIFEDLDCDEIYTLENFHEGIKKVGKII